MFQRRPRSTAPRTRTMALGGALAALAVVGGGTLVAVNAPADVEAGDILLAQNETGAAAQTMPLGTAVNLDLEPVVARAAGGAIPQGTTVQVTGLPDGLSQEGWVISGTPTRAGEYDVLVTVSNAGVSRSQKVTIIVADQSAETEPSGEGAPSTVVEPTLSAVPGGQERTGAVDDDGSGDDVEPGVGDDAGVGGEAGSGVESDDDDNAVGTGTDLCALLEGGQADGASVEQLLPLVGGEDTASTGLVAILVNAIVGLLPSVLGEDGLLGELGSAGEMLCTLAPSLLGGEGATPAGQGEAAGAAAAELLTGVQGQGEGASPPVVPALLGLLTSGAGSVDE